jgi:Flagellin and related hook-associated proteins
MVADQFLYDANASLNRYTKLYQQQTSTKKISNIADDPIATASALQARSKLSSLANYQDSVTYATNTMAESSNAAESLNEVVKSAYQLISSANSGSKTDSDYSAIAEEIAGLRDEVVSIGNSTMGTVYLFSGNSSKKPFNVSENGHLVYNGIDLSGYALRDDVSANAKTASADQTSIADLTTQLAKTDVSEYNAQDSVAPEIVSKLDEAIKAGNAAIYQAKEFGLSDDQVKAIQDAVTPLEDRKTMLEGEINQSLPDSTGSTHNLKFYKADFQAIMSGNKINIDDTTSSIYTDEELAADSTKSNASLDTLLGNLNTAMKTTVSTMNTQVDTTAASTSLNSEATAVRQLQIGRDSQMVDTSVNGLKLAGVNVASTTDAGGNTTYSTTNSNTSNIYYVLDKCVDILNGKLDKSELSGMISTLQSVQSQVLSVDSQIGTAQNRLSLIGDRYTASKTTYSTMKSDAEDADMAETITNCTTAKTVYDAALASGSKILQTSLIDFLK